jgi:hypothetical protein
VVRKKEESRGGFGNFGCVFRNSWWVGEGKDEALDSSAKIYIVKHRGGRECNTKSMIVGKHG